MKRSQWWLYFILVATVKRCKENSYEAKEIERFILTLIISNRRSSASSVELFTDPLPPSKASIERIRWTLLSDEILHKRVRRRSFLLLIFQTYNVSIPKDPLSHFSFEHQCENRRIAHRFASNVDSGHQNRSGSENAIFNGSDQAFGGQQRARNAKIFDQLSSCFRQNSASKKVKEIFICKLPT